MNESQRNLVPAFSSPGLPRDAGFRLLVETGLHLARERSLEGVARTAVDAGLHLTGAEFGAFLYVSNGDDGHNFQISETAGHAAHWQSLPLTGATPLFQRTLHHGQSLCIDDLRALAGVTAEELATFPSSLVSYVAVPVMSEAGKPVGALVYGHTAAQRFTPLEQSLLTQLSSQTSAAIDVAQLADNLSREIAIADSARAAQREYADRLTSVLESTTDGVALMDSRWRFTYFNQRAQQIVAPGRNIVGLHYYELFPDAKGSTFEQHYAEAMNERHPVEFTDYYAGLDIWAYIRVFPMADGIAIFFQDVTDQRRAENQREQTERRLRQALEAGSLGTWTWNRDTDMLDLDERAAILFYADPHVPIGRSFLRERVVAEDDRKITTDQLHVALENGNTYRAEYRVRRPGSGPDPAPGDTRWLAASAIPTFADQGNSITGMVGTVQDITERKTSEATLRQSEKLAATGRMAATIAHEINNPLEAVTNLIYLAKTDPETPPAVARQLETADSELLRVAQIAQQTLGFYRDTTRPVQINVTELLEGVRNLFSRKLDYSRLSCSLDLDPGLTIHGLQGEIRQVFSNLLVNAIDASRHIAKPRPICIRAHAAVRHGVPGVAVLVSDYGSGIPRSVFDRLYSPFVTTKVSVGTGLGLWVTRGIVEKHGGAISVRTSTGPASGTVFRVFLPREMANQELLTSPSSNLVH
jgi:PAS domain S-box-containing protein